MLGVNDMVGEREREDAPELDAGRGGGVAADAVGAGDVAALEGADGVAVDEPGKGVLLPVDLQHDHQLVSDLILRPMDRTGGLTV